jgi:hypothetical protein
VVEIRDAGIAVELTPTSAQVWTMAATNALDGSIAEATLNTRSFAESEDALKFSLGWTELDYERAKTATLGNIPTRLDHAGIDDTAFAAVRAFEEAAVTRGTQYTTFRRLAEQARLSYQCPELRAALLAAYPDRLVGPLWRLLP